MDVRDARPEDAPAVADVNVRSWRAAYHGLMPDSYLDALSVEEEAVRWQRAIAESPARGRPVLVVEAGAGAVVGYAVVGADVDDSTQGLLFLMYVAPEAWGSRAGWALMEASVERLGGAGFARAVLWVLEANGRARAFYEREGWVADGGASTATYGGVPLTALRYARELARDADVR
jgi:ribosomal protein S18 acetylase RimI-like enzyme